jgi:molybdopterin-guanine dinucleotide biosynthesis protein A
MIKDCTALILAGGESRRMGQDKASLVLNGMTLLEHVTRTMQSVFPKVIVSVRRLREDVGTQQVCDETEARGPLAGLIAGMAQVDTPWMFAVACDMPFVKAGMVEQLAKYRFDSATQNSPQAAVPMIEGHQQSLAAFYATNTLAVMRKSLATGDNSIRGALKNLTVRYVSEAELIVSDPQLGSFFDLDTPDDLTRVENIKETKKC